jgi:hypothetical protein
MKKRAKIEDIIHVIKGKYKQIVDYSMIASNKKIINCNNEFNNSNIVNKRSKMNVGQSSIAE